MFDHISAYFRKEQEEILYRAYVTECLRILTENTMHRLIQGVGEIDYGSYMKQSWYDLKAKQSKEREDTRSVDEIASDLMSRAGLKFKSGAEQNGS